MERIDNYKNSILLKSTKINYSNAFAGNASYLPQTIQVADKNQPLENRLKYNLYDEFSNYFF